MRLILIIAGLVSFGRLGLGADWSLDIIPDRSDKNGFSIDSKFVVLLTNVSGHSLRVWNENCSMGYQSFSFEVKRANGATFGLVRRPVAWAANTLSWYLVIPKGHYARAVILSSSNRSGDWEGFPADFGREKVEFKAKFSIPKENAGGEIGVWTGTVVSPSFNLILWRHRAAK